MTSVPRRMIFLAVAFALLAGAVATRWSGAADNGAGNQAAAGGTGQLYELRIYTAAPGKMDALNRRFRDHTLKFFEKHGIKSVGYWTGVDEGQQGKLYYLLAYPDKASRERMLVKGIASDPEFLKAVAESEKNGKLTAGTESVLLVPTDYSPMR